MRLTRTWVDPMEARAHAAFDVQQRRVKPVGFLHSDNRRQLHSSLSPGLKCKPRADIVCILGLHLVTRRARGQQRLPNGLLRAVADHDFVGRVLQAVLRRQLRADGLPQRRRARVGRVVRLARPESQEYFTSTAACLPPHTRQNAVGECQDGPDLLTGTSFIG